MCPEGSGIIPVRDTPHSLWASCLLTYTGKKFFLKFRWNFLFRFCHCLLSYCWASPSTAWFIPPNTLPSVPLTGMGRWAWSQAAPGRQQKHPQEHRKICGRPDHLALEGGHWEKTPYETSRSRKVAKCGMRDLGTSRSLALVPLGTSKACFSTWNPVCCRWFPGTEQVIVLPLHLCAVSAVI